MDFVAAVVGAVVDDPKLERRAGKLTLPYRDVQRAKVVPYAAEGMSNVEIAGWLEMLAERSS